jgi:hypothetical protein
MPAPWPWVKTSICPVMRGPEVGGRGVGQPSAKYRKPPIPKWAVPQETPTHELATKRTRSRGAWATARRGVSWRPVRSSGVPVGASISASVTGPGGQFAVRRPSSR